MPTVMRGAMLACPSARGHVPECVADLVRLATGLRGVGIRVEYRTTRITGVHAARDLLVSAFLESECDHLLFLDDDTTFDDCVNVGRRMLALLRQYEAVGVAYPHRHARDRFCVGLVPGQPISPLMRASFVGTGIMAIARRAFDLIDRRPELLPHAGGYFQPFARDGGASDDGSFCGRLRAAAGSISVITDVVAHHWTQRERISGRLDEHMRGGSASAATDYLWDRRPIVAQQTATS